MKLFVVSFWFAKMSHLQLRLVWLYWYRCTWYHARLEKANNENPPSITELISGGLPVVVV